MLKGNIKQFASYSHFKDLKEFNTHIEMFLSLHKKDFTASEYILFRRLTKYAATVAGLSNACINTILDAVKKYDFKLGVSESTFHRMKRKAVKLGILEYKLLIREDGSNSGNLWIFKRFVSNKKANDTTQTNTEQLQQAPVKDKVVDTMTPLKSSINSKSNNLLTNKRKTNRENDLSADFTSDSVPKPFKELAGSFFDSAKRIEGLWRRVNISAWRNFCEEPQDKLDTAIAALQQSVRSYKLGKVKTTFERYFYGVMERKFDHWYGEHCKQFAEYKDDLVSNF